MGRSNVIIVGSVVLAPLILGIESYVLWRRTTAGRRPRQIAGAMELTATPDRPRRSSQSPVGPRLRTPSPRLRPAPAAPAAVDAPRPRPRPSATFKLIRRSSDDAS